MDKIAVVTDSVACLPRELAEKYKISVVPAGNIYSNGRVYRDWIDLSHDEAYRILEHSPTEFFTGPPSPADFLDLFKKLSKEHNIIIHVSLSSKLSTLHNVARLASEMAKNEINNTHIEIVDSRTATAAEGFIALAAAKAAQEGKNFQEVMKIVDEVREKVDLYYVLDTVKYVYRTGRVPRPVADFGSKLNVKPLVTISSGIAQIRGFVRNRKKGIESLLRIARQQINNNPVHMAILHADALEDAEVLKQKILDEFTCKELWVGQFSPLMVYATGKGVLGIAFYVDNSHTSAA